ncbi:hypothetical protein VTI28DRAFT_50 [Corynascus sepedonium]
MCNSGTVATRSVHQAEDGRCNTLFTGAGPKGWHQRSCSSESRPLRLGLSVRTQWLTRPDNAGPMARHVWRWGWLNSITPPEIENLLLPNLVPDAVEKRTWRSPLRCY